MLRSTYLGKDPDKNTLAIMTIKEYTRGQVRPECILCFETT